MTDMIATTKAVTDRHLENVVNRLNRHCRIGKVTLKAASFWNTWLGDRRLVTDPQYMDKCGCKVGTACGNAACPHRLVATC